MWSPRLRGPPPDPLTEREDEDPFKPAFAQRRYLERRSLGFYCGVPGFELMQRFGAQAAFISAGGYHPHIGLNTWESAGGSPPSPGTTGIYHLAILYPTRTALADALRRLRTAGIRGIANEVNRFTLRGLLDFFSLRADDSQQQAIGQRRFCSGRLRRRAEYSPMRD